MPPRSSALAVLAGCMVTPSIGRAQAVPVTVHVASSADDPVSPVLYAIRTGMFAKVGLDVQISRMNGGAAISAAVAGGALDIGKSSLLGLVLGHLRGVPFTMIAPSGIWTGENEGGLIVAASSPIHTAKDFAGKTISAASTVDINTLATQAWIDQNGGDPRAVKFVELPPLAAPAALEAGRVDAATLFNPAYTQAVGSGKARLVALIFNAIAKRFLEAAWFTTTDYVAKNRSVVERFSRVVAQASVYANTHRDETLDDIVAFTNMDKAVVAHMQRAGYAPTLTLADVQPVIDVAVKYKAIDHGFPASELISDAAAK